MKSEFFNPDDCEFEVLGFFEDLIDATTRKLIGSRDLDTPTRPTGSPGMLEYDITAPVQVTRGVKHFTLNASPKRPRRVLGIIQIKCGRKK